MLLCNLPAGVSECLQFQRFNSFQDNTTVFVLARRHCCIDFISIEFVIYFIKYRMHIKKEIILSILISDN